MRQDAPLWPLDQSVLCKQALSPINQTVPSEDERFAKWMSHHDKGFTCFPHLGLDLTWIATIDLDVTHLGSGQW